MDRNPQFLGSVVVGIEEHNPSAALLSAASDEADRRNATLAVVTVLPHRTTTTQSLTSDPGSSTDETELVSRAEALRADRPWLTVKIYRLRSEEVEPDREPLRSTGLLVIGAHSTAGVQAFGPDTVSWRLLRAACCPVLVVPDRPGIESVQRSDQQRPVVLAGLSGKRSDPTVIRTAYAEARRRHGDLQLLHAYTPGGCETFAAGLDRAIDVVHRATCHIAPPPDVRTAVILTEDKPAPALCLQATHAAILVLAARSGSMAGLIGGAVSRQVMAEAPCTVLAVPWLLIDQKRSHETTVEHSTPSRP